jgi:hypothetical protein
MFEIFGLIYILLIHVTGNCQGPWNHMRLHLLSCLFCGWCMHILHGRLHLSFLLGYVIISSSCYDANIFDKKKHAFHESTLPICVIPLGASYFLYFFSFWGLTSTHCYTALPQW